MLKLLHIADLHLDSRFVGISVTEATRRRAELRSVFKNALSYAKKERCSLTLISGDLFDGEYYTLDTLKFLSECFTQMPEHKFIIAPGNHDPMSAASPYRYADFPENVFIFESESLSSFDFNDLGITVYGYAFTSDYYGKNPLAELSALPVTENFNILCAHTELDAYRSPYAPISTAALTASGFDYAALGHIHKSEGVKKTGRTVYAYSGCIAGRDFSETGEKGGLIVSLDKVGKAKSVSATPVRFCPWVYENVQVSVDGTASVSEIADTVRKKLSQLKKDSSLEYVIRVILAGQTCAAIDTEALAAQLNSLGVREIKDETHYAHTTLNLSDDYSLRGEFYRTLKPLLESEDPAKRKQAEMALKYGLAALNAGEIEI